MQKIKTKKPTHGSGNPLNARVLAIANDTSLTLDTGDGSSVC